MKSNSVFLRSILSGIAIVAACSACSNESEIPVVSPPSSLQDGAIGGRLPSSSIVEITPDGFTEGNQAYAWCAYGNLYVVYTGDQRGGLTSTAQDPVCADNSVPQ